MNIYDWSAAHPFLFFLTLVFGVLIAVIVGETVSSFARRKP